MLPHCIRAARVFCLSSAVPPSLYLSIGVKFALCIFIVVRNQKRGGLIPVVITTVTIYFIRYGADAAGPTDVTGQATVAVALSIEFSAQLLLVESPLPTFFCFISCSVFVPL